MAWFQKDENEYFDRRVSREVIIKEMAAELKSLRTDFDKHDAQEQKDREQHFQMNAETNKLVRDFIETYNVNNSRKYNGYSPDEVGVMMHVLHEIVMNKEQNKLLLKKSGFSIAERIVWAIVVAIVGALPYITGHVQ